MRAASSAAIVLLGIGVAAASPADDAFKKGRELLKAKQWADACTAFEESERLEPAFGTRFNIAQCSEPQGKLATALAIYRELAAKDTNATRKAASAELVKQLEARVPKLQIQIDPKPASPTITLNGAPLACTAPCDLAAGVPVDLGSYAIGVSAEGFSDGIAKAEVRDEGRTIVVAVRLIKLEGRMVKVTPPPVTTPPITRAPPPTAKPGTAVERTTTVAPNGRKRAAVATLVVSGVAIALGAGAGVRANSKWNEAKDVCGGSTTCPDPVSAQTANDLADTARGRGNIATALFVAGGIVATTGIYLYVTASRRTVHVHVTTTGDSVGATLAGRF